MVSLSLRREVACSEVSWLNSRLEVAQVYGFPIAGEEIYQKRNPNYGYGDDPQAETYDLIAGFDCVIIVEYTEIDWR